MYIPDYFNDSTLEEVKEVIKNNSFGILINTTQGKLWATHIPMELTVNDKGEDVLVGHVSKGNKQWKAFTENKEVLVIFQGPHAYVSSTWYNHENVPTWNYVAVHIHGSISIIKGEALYNALKRLIHTYETKTETNLKIEDLSEKLVKKEMRGIVGFEIKIEEIKAAFKLSQNRDDESYKNVVNALEASENQNEISVATYMKHRREANFSDDN
ncbi:MAG: FMN-binding negative transcriptional regulator [Bacteroidota bacterium]